jgi:hypothetical protein
MAIIPKAKGQGFVSTEVSRRPTESIESAGLVGKAMQGFAKGLGDVGQALVQVNAQQEKIEADAMSSKLVNDALVDAKESEQVLKQETEGNHANYASEYTKRVDFIKKQINSRKDISDLTKKLFNNKFQNSERRLKIGALNYQFEQRTKFNYDLDQQAITSYANNLSVDPDPTEALKKMAATEATFKNPSKYTGDQATQGVKQGRNSIFEGLMSGYENTDDPESALEILNNELEGHGDILKGIDEGKVQTWRRRFERQLATKTKVNKFLFKSQIQDLESATFDNRKKAPQGLIESLEQNAIAMGDRKAYGKINILKKSNEMIQSIKDYDNEDLQKLRAGLSQSPEFKVLGIQDAAEKNRLAKRMKDYISQMIEFRNKKGADYALEIDKSLVNLSAQAAALEPKETKTYLERTKTVQESKQIANPKILTDSMAEAYAPLFNVKDGETLDPEATKNSIVKFKKAFLDKTPQAVEELIDRKIIDRATSYAFYTDDPKLMERIVSINTTDTKTLIDISKEKFAQEKTDFKSESSNMFADTTIQDYEDALSQTIGKKAALLKTEPMKELSRKLFAKYAATMSVDDAKKKAISDLSSQWTTLNADNNVIIPTDQLEKMSLGKERLEETLDLMKVHMPEIKEAYDIPVPSQYKIIESSPEAALEKWNKDIADRGMWLTSSDMTGVVLYMDNGTERPSVVAGKGNKPIKITWKELHNGFDWQYLQKNMKGSKLVQARQDRVKKLQKIADEAWVNILMDEGF